MLISGVWVSFLVVAYTGLIVTIPRAGGDYVWQSGSSAARSASSSGTGWWFILWLWAPIYGTVLNVELSSRSSHLGARAGDLFRHPQRHFRSVSSRS